MLQMVYKDSLPCLVQGSQNSNKIFERDSDFILVENLENVTSKNTLLHCVLNFLSTFQCVNVVLKTLKFK